MRAPEHWARPGGAARWLAPAGCLWAWTGRLRRRLTTPCRLTVPTICVGNLVAGGAGKTPVALSLAAALAERGRNVHLLSRGYGGRLKGPVRVDPDRHGWREVGDEPLLLARQAPTWVARDRAAGGRAAVAAGADALVLDDGLQNPALAYDLALLVVDGGYGFGNGRVMPAGPLREPVGDALARVHAVVLLGDDETGLIDTLAPARPILRARLVPGPEGEQLAGRRVLGFAGIGRPEKFFRTLADLRADVVGTAAFPDHHPYDPDEVMRLVERAAALRARPVTTAKDFVRLPPAGRAMVDVLSVTLAWKDPVALDRLLDGALGHAPADA